MKTRNKRQKLLVHVPPSPPPSFLLLLLLLLLFWCVQQSDYSKTFMNRPPKENSSP
ncbi:hypothetical protein COCMIDRAFT_83195 [Bipolaris oryzae ATCC 44560]|uniref:Uncharacterized protein n=1 Tax=Bipolaris oryzae ATCC 44560 TaxID=930090 RepID=W6ZIU9_COCMI|nr:uncharacterized protein COCMIDRAFT_83195 [Bipolaris oryzae ATCC 44560]EUC49928.1 hypothetical protein COCMIDRAFT_83195 [Bipolaris oryzae ATCC 44560]